MNLHQRLIERHSTEELKRKKLKARRRGFYTIEDIDYAKRRAMELKAILDEPKLGVTLKPK